jgi:hypothetical protein
VRRREETPAAGSGDAVGFNHVLDASVIHTNLFRTVAGSNLQPVTPCALD